MRLLYIDTETTNTDPTTGGLLQICAEYEEDGKVVNKINKKCNPSHVKTDLGALSVNKIKFSDSATRTNEEVALKEFCDFMLDIPVDKSNPVVIVGHNVHFDVSFLESRLKQLLDVTGLKNLTSYRYIDTSSIGECLRRAEIIKISRMSLENLAKALDVKFDNSELHDAENDVELTRKVYNKMLETLKSLS